MPPKGVASTDKGLLPPHLRINATRFRLPNGDRYEGEFLANIKTKTICRQGIGTYKTWNGDTYTATWENDAIAKGTELQMDFADGCSFVGTVTPAMEYAEGTYRFHDGGTLRCRFGKRNVPLDDGQLVFTDAHGQRWDHALEKQWLRVRLPQRFGVDGDKRSGPEVK